MRELLRKARPERLDDLIALNALYRPGPLKSGMVDDYIARKQGAKEVKYDFKELEPILSDTYGVIAYQEQVMLIAQALAGFTLAQADMLRKAMGKKDPKVMAKMRDDFMAGAVDQGVQREEGGQGLRPDGVLRRVRLQQVALDRLRVPRVPDGVPQGELSRSTSRRRCSPSRRRTPRSWRCISPEARDRGIRILPPDINRSQLNFSVDKEADAVRFGLTAIKGLGEGAINSIIESRDTARRPDSVAARALRECSTCAWPTSACSRRWSSRARAIRWCGRLGRPAASLGGPGRSAPRSPSPSCARSCSRRSTAPANTARGSSATRTWGSSTCSAAATTTTAARPVVPLPDVPPWSEIDQLNFEKESLGLFWSGHPIDRYADDLRDYGAKTVLELNPRKAESGDEEPVPSSRATKRSARARWRRRLPRPPAANGSHANNGGERKRQGGRNWRDRDPGDEVSIGGIVSGLRPLKTAQGRPHVRLHARRRRRQPRDRGVPGDVQAVGPRRRDRPAGAGQGQVREGRRDGADRRVGDRADRHGARAAGEGRDDPRLDHARAAARRSSGCGTCSRRTRAIGASRS